MPPTFFGRAISPADSAANLAQSVTVTPPGSMVAGDLVYLVGFADDAFTPTITISNLGGQTWTTIDDTTLHGFGIATRRFWCEFDGTWDANPVLAQSGPAVEFSALMLVARHGPEGMYWRRNVATFSTMSDSAAPFDLVYPTSDLNDLNEIVFVEWARDVIHEMTLQTAGWTNPSGESQWRNVGPDFQAFTSMAETIPSGADNIGTQVLFPGVAHTKGSWTQLIASTTFDAYWMTILIHQSNSPGNDTSTLLDIGTGAAAAETVLIPNLLAGFVANFAGKEYNFPVFIPSGTRIAARVQGARTTGGPRVAIILYGASGYGAWVASNVEDIGTNLANSRGTVVTAGNGAEGAWTSLGVPTADTQMLALGIQPNGVTAMTPANFAIDIGSGDPSPTLIIENLGVRVLAAEQGGPYPAWVPITREIPIDETIWVRMQTHVGTNLVLDVATYAMQS